MKELKFNSQICTTKEQSQRLIDLGLNSETADMLYMQIDGTWICIISQGDEEYVPHEDQFPAWSLHRLIEMCNKIHFGMTIGIYNDEVIIDGDLFNTFNNYYHNTYDNLISIIEWTIKLGLFNKKYLKQ